VTKALTHFDVLALVAAAMGILAAVLPARRASPLNMIQALRSD
jgi:ABC-type antimicrobial peptide transport system permease subunit